jgi:aminoglycoside 3-N-acetyltransferase
MSAVLDEMAAALGKVGLQAGDIALVHSDVSAIIRMTGGDDWGVALGVLKEALLQTLGEQGTLVVPTFNWEFCQGRPYDHAKTPSRQGLFSNFIRTSPGAVRSFHPMFSFAALGRQAESLVNGISKSSFGHDSVFHRLHQRGAKLVFVDTTFFVCTFTHYIEQMHGVSYRYQKFFTGQVTVDGSTYEDTFEFYVRDEKQVVNSLPTKLGERMRAKGSLHAAQVGDAVIEAATCEAVFDEAVAAMTEDPFFLLKDPPVPAV